MFKFLVSPVNIVMKLQVKLLSFLLKMFLFITYKYNLTLWKIWSHWKIALDQEGQTSLSAR